MMYTGVREGGVIMGVDMENWMKNFSKAILDEFGEEVRFIGLQGSRGRGEATEESDIDVVVIFDELTPERAKRYRNVIAKLPERDKICGFVSGWAELAGWDRADLFQFCYDTVPVFGGLNELRGSLTIEDAMRSVHVGACGIYHACCHNLLHERSDDILAGLRKAAFFALRAKYFCESGEFVKKKSELASLLCADDRDILFAAGDFDEISAKLLNWSGALIKEYGGLSQ